MVEKGSVTVDGVSLTVASRLADRFGGRAHSAHVGRHDARRARGGRRLNFEVDILAKYVQRALAARGLAGAPE